MIVKYTYGPCIWSEVLGGHSRPDPSREFEKFIKSTKGSPINGPPDPVPASVPKVARAAKKRTLERPKREIYKHIMDRKYETFMKRTGSEPCINPKALKSTKSKLKPEVPYVQLSSIKAKALPPSSAALISPFSNTAAIINVLHNK